MLHKRSLITRSWVEGRAWPDLAEMIGGYACDQVSVAYLGPLLDGCADINQWIATATLLAYLAARIKKRF